MADQNQNPQNSQNSQTQIPGTFRTLKTDLGEVSPQDRLQQAGNFVQARPALESTPSPTPVVSISTPEKTVASTSTLQTAEKKDVPATEAKPKESYSWSNMSSSQVNIPKTDNNINLSTVSNNSSKSGFSVLDDTIDLPLNNSLNKDININSNENSFNNIPASSDLNINNFNPNQSNTVNPKSNLKPIISGVIVIVLLVLIGGGIYLFNTSRTNNNNTSTNNTSTNNTDQPPTPNPEPNTTPIESPLFANIPKVNVAFVDSEPIRRTITSRLADKKDVLIELNLIKDNTKISLIDTSAAFGLNIPFINDIKQYWFYAYNQEGIYKLTAVIELNEGKQAREIVDNWGNSIPRDLSGFSINLPSRIVNTPNIKNTTIVTDSGKSFNNNYYNYTSPVDSIDVSSYENYILMASSQDSMRYILKQIP